MDRFYTLSLIQQEHRDHSLLLVARYIIWLPVISTRSNILRVVIGSQSSSYEVDNRRAREGCIFDRQFHSSNVSFAMMRLISHKTRHLFTKSTTESIGALHALTMH